MQLHAERAGYSLIELLIALLLTALMGAVLLGLLLAQLALARVTAQRALTAEATRTALHAIGGELRRTRPADIRAVSSDSLALRSFRGTGIVCAVTGNELHLRYRGDRLPDATKDSVLLLPSGRVAPLTESGAAPFACSAQPGETIVFIRVPAFMGEDAVALVFESGAYYLTSRALRYRLGAEGRQPLTGELFLHPQTRFHPRPDGVAIDISVQRAYTRSFSALHAPR
jgi:type II secretory pathway pseudopilin PulG